MNIQNNIAIAVFVLLVGMVLIAINLPTQKLEYQSKDYPNQEAVLIYAEITAYTSDFFETDSEPETMASGLIVYDGAIACPAKYSFGVRFEINGDIYVCEDRMNIRYRDRNYFDIYVGGVEKKQEALDWGRQNLLIKEIVE